jgi:hypothetical protein
VTFSDEPFSLGLEESSFRKFQVGILTKSSKAEWLEEICQNNRNAIIFLASEVDVPSSNSELIFWSSHSSASILRISFSNSLSILSLYQLCSPPIKIF